MENSLLISIVLIFLNLALTCGVGIIAFFLRDYRGSIERRFDEQAAKVEKVVDDLHDFKAALPQIYVLRDDFVRAMTGFDHKLDRQWEAIQQVRREIGGPDRS